LKRLSTIFTPALNIENGFAISDSESRTTAFALDDCLFYVVIHHLSPVTKV